MINGLSGLRIFTVILLAVAVGLTGCSGMSRAQREKRAQAHYKLGISYLNDNQLQLGFIEFHKAIEVNPKDRDSHYGLGHVYFAQGRYKEAVEAFKKAIRIDPNFSEAHNYLGTVYDRLSEWDSAISEFRLALANPKYATPHFSHHNMGSIYLNQGNFKEAAQAFIEALRVAPEYPLAYTGLGQVYFREEKFREAVEAFSNALKLAPGYTEAHYYLGQTYLKSGSNKLAREEFEEVIRQAPDSELADRSRQSLELLR